MSCNNNHLLVSSPYTFIAGPGSPETNGSSDPRRSRAGSVAISQNAQRQPPSSTGRVTQPSLSRKPAGSVPLLAQAGRNAEPTRNTLSTQGFQELIALGVQHLLRKQLQLEA